jgi:pyruvate dehydrogenase E1 component alpha subunit
MDEEGTIVTPVTRCKESLAETAEPGHVRLIPKTQLQEMLRRMLRIRLFDECATAIQADSIAGPVHNSIGQEAEIVGACMALREDDYMTGNHRSHGHPIGKGVGLGPLMAELLGRKTGVCRGKGGSMHLAAFDVGSLGESGIVGGSMPAATGAALSARLRGTDQVCLCFFGDGAANCGPFHESLNLASVWQLPVIFFCENNGYGMCTPQVKTTSVADIANRAVSYSMPGVIVDGQDVLAVHQAVTTAVVRARAGNGPSLIEAKTYRYCEHQEGVVYPPYRSDQEVSLWRERDPIGIFVAKLRDLGILTAEELDAVRSQIRAEVATALVFARQSPLPGPEAVLEDLFV